MPPPQARTLDPRAQLCLTVAADAWGAGITGLLLSLLSLLRRHGAFKEDLDLCAAPSAFNQAKSSLKL